MRCEIRLFKVMVQLEMEGTMQNGGSPVLLYARAIPFDFTNICNHCVLKIKYVYINAMYVFC